MAASDLTPSTIVRTPVRVVIGKPAVQTVRMSALAAFDCLMTARALFHDA